MSNQEIFKSQGCVRVDNFVDNKTISVVSQYLENRIRIGEWKQDENEPTSKYSYYADPLIEALLLERKATVEEVIEKELLPTYSYARIYQPGEELEPHVDRESCEVSVTVNVAVKGENSPIYMQYKNNDPEKHVLGPGDAVIYKGCEAMHWRRPLNKDQLVVQFMLHYVDKNGPNAEYAKDKRPAYGMSSLTRSQ